MGRPQILGRETCPKCGKLGRTRKKNVRSRMGGRYVDRSYFHHNDKSIPEHYVDNYTRFASWEYEKHPLGKTLKAIDTLCKAHDTIEYGTMKLEKMLKKYHGANWTRWEKWSFYNALEDVWNNVIERDRKRVDWYRHFADMIRYDVKSWLVLDDDRLLKRLGLTKVLSDDDVPKDKIVETAINHGHGPLLEQLVYLFEKYEIPRRRQRDKDRRKKLSKWEGRPTNDFTGVENSIPFSA